MHYILSTWRVVGMEGGHDLLVGQKLGTFPFEVGIKLRAFQTYVYGSSM